MPDIDLTVEMQARQVNREFLARQGLLKGRNRVYLVPYPRSGNTRSENTFPFCKAVVLVCPDLLKTRTALSL